MSKKKLIIIVVLIALVAVLGIVLIRIFYLNNLAENDKNTQNALEEFVSEETPSIAPASPTPTATPLPTTDKSLLNYKNADKIVDFEGLQSKNEDIFGWITIPGTDIDYALVHDNQDNFFYLDKNPFKEESVNGSIYLAMENSNTLEDKNSVIYGHNMKDGSMFAQLHKYGDKAYFDDPNNKIVKIYTPIGMLEYEIFAAYVTGDENILYDKNFADDIVYQDYLDNIGAERGVNNHLSNTEISIDDRIITLSTCIKGKDENRYFVQAVLK